MNLEIGLIESVVNYRKVLSPFAMNTMKTVGCLLSSGAKHPRIDFFIDSEDIEREYFCSLYFGSAK